MLEIATTKSMTNSMHVPLCSSAPSRWIKMKVLLCLKGPHLSVIWAFAR